MTAKPIRCFIALTLSQDTQDRLAEIQTQLKNDGAQARWVKPHNIHLTLRFLGDRSPKRVKDIAKHFTSWFHDTKGFPVIIDTLKCFPNEKKPRVLWAGFSKGNEEVIQIYEHLEQELAKSGLPKEHEDFIPHLTLARCKTPEEMKSTAKAIATYPSASSGSIQPSHLRSLRSVNMGLIEKAPTFSVEARIETITFYKSTLTSKGSIYEPIASVRLKTKDQ